MRNPFAIYRVSGESMLPTYGPGDTLLGWRWFRPRPGQVVVALHRGRPLIKRIDHIRPDGRIWLLGDNPSSSTDSRTLGPVQSPQLVAWIIARLG